MNDANRSHSDAGYAVRYGIVTYTMNSAIKRILSSLVLLAIFGLALYLRLYGSDWGFKDTGHPNQHSNHPDERHYQNCASDMRPQWLSEAEKELPLREQAKLLYQRNLEVTDQSKALNKAGNPGLKPVNYNYGTFPTHIYLLYRVYLAKHYTPENGWVFLAFPDWLSLTLIAFALLIGLKMFRRLSRDLREIEGRRIPWYKDEQRLSFFFPCLIIPLTGLALCALFPTLVVDYSRYNNPGNASILLTGRVVMAYAGALSVLLAYLIGRDAYNRATGLIAACMLATAMLHVQTSHYATTDVMLGFWSTAAVYCFLRIAQRPRLIWYCLGAICTGFAIGTKWSGVALPGILFLAHAVATWGDDREGKTGRWIHTVWLSLTALVLVHFFKAAGSTDPKLDVAFAAFRDFYWNHVWLFGFLIVLLFSFSIYFLILRKRWHSGEIGWFRPSVRIYWPWVCLAIAVVIGLAAFLFAEPMAYFDSGYFAKNIAEQSNIITTGKTPAVYTRQFNHATPVFYLLDNLFYPSLDWLTAFFVLAGCLYALVRMVKKCEKSDLILTAWVVPSFILYGTFHAMFPRYLDAILPVMVVLGARLIVDLVRIQPQFYMAELPGLGVGSKKLLKRFGLVGGALALFCGLIYSVSYVKMYDQPLTMVTAGQFVQQHFLQAGKKVTDQSWDEGLPGVHVQNRFNVHTDPYIEERDPKQRVRYLARTLSQNDGIILPSKRGYGTTLHNPELFPMTNQFMKALFAEQLGFRIAKVIDNPPRFLSWEFRADEEDETARIYDHPKIVIFEKMHDFSEEELEELIWSPPAWVTQITAKEILNLRDGFPVYKTPPSNPVLRWWLIVQILGWIAFILLFPLASYLPDRAYGISKAVGIALFAWIGWFLASVNAFPFSRFQGLVVLVLLLILAVRMLMKYREPIKKFLCEKWALIVGMEILYLVLWAVFLMIRAYHPAAYDGERSMNVSFVHATYRAETFPPEDPWISGYGINYYYYGQAMLSVAGKFIGVPPEFLFNIGGTCISALTGLGIFALAYALCRRVWISMLALYLGLFAGHLISYFNYVRLFKNSQIGFWDCISYIGSIFSFMWVCIVTYTGQATPEITERLRSMGANWNLAFYDAAHNIIPSTVASEFPYWTNLFMDFHAHMLVVPFTLAFLTLLYGHFARPCKENPLGILGGMTFFLGLLFGTVICTNTWDVPGLALGLLFILAVKFFRESELMERGKIRAQWMAPESLQTLVREHIAPLLLIVVFAVLLFFPFHFNFVSRVTSVRWMTEGQTTLLTYLGMWTHLLFPIIIAIILLTILRKDGRISFVRTMVFAIFVMLSVTIALYISTANPFDYPKAQPNGDPLNYTVAGLFIPFLLLLFMAMCRRDRSHAFVFSCLIGVLGLGLSMGIEFFYVWEGWSAPLHRWNTAFKFNLQVWYYFAIFAAISSVWVWQHIKQWGAITERRYLSLSFRMMFASVMIVLIAATIPFTVIAPAMVTKTAGAYGRDAKGEMPSLDSLGWLREKNYSAYSAVQWFNRFTQGNSHVVEYSVADYYARARFSTNTGLPALIGWPHHVGERIHYRNEKTPRVNAVKKIYTSPDKEEVRRLLGQYQIEYLIFGEVERTDEDGREGRRALGKAPLERFEQWGDMLHLAYRFGDTSIFAVDKSLNYSYGIDNREVKPKLPPALHPPERGNSMFNAKRGSGNGEFLEARGFVIDATGNAFIADTSNNRIQVFRPNGSYAWQVGREGSRKGEFKQPNDVTVDSRTGNLYVADTWNQRIVLLDKYGVFGGSASLGFFGPRGIVFHPEWQLLYVADTGNHRVVVITPDGQINQKWGVAGGGTDDKAFREPWGIDVIPDGNVIVTESLNRRAKIYTPKGELVRLWPIQTDWKGEGGLENYVACLSDGSIYITDSKEDCVHVYNAEGELLDKIYKDVSGKALKHPLGISVGPKGQVFVNCLGLNRIVRIK